MIKVIELLLLIVGVILMIYASSSGYPLLIGVGLGLAIQSAIMLAFDYFAHERGEMYFDFLQSL